MPLAEYLASEQAREDVRKANRELDQCAGLAYGLGFGWLRADIVKIWRRVWTEVDGEVLATAYYRPDGDRYVVTDLGEGVRALRLRTGCTHYEAMERSDPMREALRTSGIGNVWSAERGIMELDSITPFDLPDALCRVMLASLRVAQS